MSATTQSHAFTLADVACAIEVPGTASLAAVFLLRDGTFRNNAYQATRDRVLAEQWIARHGDAFRKANADLLASKEH